MPHLSEPTERALQPGERSFRGASIDQALAAARQALGEDVEAIAANRIRRGGVGGFFATDLGVEVIVLDPDPEYLDRPEPTDGPGDSPIGGRSAASAGPAALVSTIDGPVRPIGIDRLLDAADRRERDTRAEINGVSDAPNLVSAPFAEHLRRHLLATGQLDEADLAESRVAGAHSEATEPAGRPPSEEMPSLARGSSPKTTAEFEDGPGSSPTTGSMPEMPGLDARGEPPRRTAAVPPEPVAAPEAGPTRPPTVDRGGGRRRDPYRRPVDVATGAVGRLVEQLSEVVAAEGSRVDRLSRIYVTVTTPDGDVIQVGAELDGGAA